MPVWLASIGDVVLLLSAFGAFFSVQLIKVIWPVTLPRLAKMVLVLGIAALVTGFMLPKHFSISELVIYSLAGAGISISVHRVVRLFIVLGDHFVRVNIRKATGRG